MKLYVYDSESMLYICTFRIHYEPFTGASKHYSRAKGTTFAQKLKEIKPSCEHWLSFSNHPDMSNQT